MLVCRRGKQTNFSVVGAIRWCPNRQKRLGYRFTATGRFAWIEHLLRHPDLPANLFLLLWAQDDLWLDTLRALHSNPDGGSLRSATGTRAGPGKPFRWRETWVSAIEESLGWANPDKCRALSRERAAMVEKILRNGRMENM